MWRLGQFWACGLLECENGGGLMRWWEKGEEGEEVRRGKRMEGFEGREVRVRIWGGKGGGGKGGGRKEKA